MLARSICLACTAVSRGGANTFAVGVGFAGWGRWNDRGQSIKSQEKGPSAVAARRMTKLVVPLVAFSSSILLATQAFTSSADSFRTRRRVQSILFESELAIDISEGAIRDIGSFEAWASDYGIQRSEGFQLVGEEDISSNLDVSAITTGDMSAGECVLYIPQELILSSYGAMEEFGRLDEAEALLTQNGHEGSIREYYLILKILKELELGEESPWTAYFNSLPRLYSNGASMTQFCYACLPPYAAKICKDERARLNNLSVKRVVPFLSNDTKGNTKAWKFAYNLAYTRGFGASDGSNEYRIVPMADYCNHHSTESNVEMVFDEFGNCYVQTTRDVPANTPLLMNYGESYNPSFLLARYGFLDESSPASFCKILPSHVSNEMKDLGYSHETMLFYHNGEVAEEVWDHLLYVILGQTDVDMQQSFYQAHMAGDYETKSSIHNQYSGETVQGLIEHIDTFLLDLDAKSSKVDYSTQPPSEHPRLPLILRHNEFVRNVFLTVRSQQGGFIGL